LGWRIGRRWDGGRLLGIGGGTLLDAHPRGSQNLVCRLAHANGLSGRGVGGRGEAWLLDRRLRQIRLYRGGLRRPATIELPGPGLRLGLLQRTDGVVERQPMRFKKSGSGALAVPNDRCQHDRAVDLLALGLLRSLSGGLQHLDQFGVGGRLLALVRAHVLHQPAEINRSIRAQPVDIHVAGAQHT
jgi:hypothetical protein